MRLTWVALPLLGAFLAVRPLNAQTAAASEPPASTRPQRNGLVLLALRGDELPREQLRRALAEELGREVALELEATADAPAGVVTVSYRRASSQLAVTWDSAGRTVSRVIVAAPDVDDVVVDSVLLAGNLAREQVERVAPPPAQSAEPPRVAEPTPQARTAPVLTPLAPKRQPPRRVATASILYPLATHHDAPDATSYLDVNLIYGRVGALEGLGLGVVNVVAREQEPYVNGLQLGALVNVNTGELRGIQLASLLNLAGARAQGLQLALGANLARSDVQGLQASIAFNRAGNVAGAQIGVLNVAGHVDGLQLGVVNIAGKVRGASVGLVNIAEDIDGLPLAPISVTRTGGVHPVLWSGSSGFGNAGVKFATRQTYTLFFGSAHRDFGRELFGGGLAIGGRIPLGAGFHVDIDVGGAYLVAPSLSTDAESGQQYREQLVQPRLRMLVAFRAAKHFGIFLGGAALGQLRSELGWDRVSEKVGPEVIGGVEL